MKRELVDIVEYGGEGYKPLIAYESWRVAELRYCEELEVQNITNMQKHMETDEIFVLLAGEFTLFTGGRGEHIGEIEAIKLEPCKLYNVKKGTWHTHTPEMGSTTLVIENDNTSDFNSPLEELSAEQKKILKSLYSKQDD